MAQLLEPTDELTLDSPVEFTVHAPGTLKTIKRNGKVASYDPSKIEVALSKAFIAVEGGSAASSDRIHQHVETLTQQITSAFARRLPNGGTIHIEDIQDQVELALMRSGDYKVARAYVLYREERRKARETTLKAEAAKGDTNTPLISMPDGSVKPLDLERMNTLVTEACRDLKDVKPAPILKDALRNLYHQAKLDDVHKALIMAARALVEKEPNYSYVSARLSPSALR